METSKYCKQWAISSFTFYECGVQRLGVPPYPEESGETPCPESMDSGEDIV